MRIVIAVALVACAPKPQHTIPIALLLDGDRAAVGDPPKVAGLELRAIELPKPAAAPVDTTAETVSRARSAYAKGDFAGCRSELARVDVGKLLVAGDRALASRALTFEAACAWGAMDQTPARATAARLASFGLELPDTPVSPDVERVIGDAILAVGKTKLEPLAVSGQSGARLTIDGRPAGCALPCTIDVTAGDHVLAVDADGFAPAMQTVRSPDAKYVAIAQQPASAELAALQWRARIGRGLPPADATGAALLGKLSGASRIAYVHGDARLTGALVVEGKLVASTSRDRGDPSALVRELAYDGGVLQRPTLWQRPWFWIAVSAGALVVAGAVVAVTYQPAVHTIGGF